MTARWWSQVEGDQLAQGDLLPNCLIPKITVLNPNSLNEVIEGQLDRSRLIVMTQSCDLANRKTTNVSLCPIFRLDEYEKNDQRFQKKGAWENVRKGRQAELHLLASPADPADNRDAFVVDFGNIVSLPFEYLTGHAKSLGLRWRLDSPFLEHFSQAFARFFMRVGLPTDIAPYR